MGVVKGDNSLFFATALDNSGLRQGSLDAVGLIQNMGSKIAAINPFAALAVGAIGAFTIIASGAYKMAKDFEQAMKEVETISAATQGNFKGISQAVFEMSKITPDGPEKLAKAYYQIVSAGYDGEKGLKLLEAASKGAVAGVTDTITAADGLTTVLNAFGLEADKVNDVSDILFTTVRLGKTTFSELSSTISQVAPLAAASGIGFEEVAAAIATLTKQGVPTAQAMTQIRAAIISTNEALGDGWSNTLTLQEAFQLLFEEAGGSQTKLREMLGTVEAMGAVLGISGDKAKGAAEDLEAMGNAAGSSEDAFKRMSSSNVNQIDILKNRIRATTKGIGDAVLEMSNDIAGGLNKIFEPLDAVVKSLQDERLELLKLESVIKDTNTSNEERVKLIQELKDKYPGLLSNIDAETISNEELSLSIQKVNNQLINKIILAKKDAEINDQNETIAEKRLDFLEREEKLREKLVQLADKEGIKLKDNATLLEQSRDFLKQAGPQEGGVLINPITKFANDIYQLQQAQKYLNIAEKEGVNLLEEKQKLADRLGITIQNNTDVISEETKKQLVQISAITKDQYKANKGILDEFLKSEDKSIAAAAKKRKEAFDFKPTGGDGDKKDLTFEDSLKQKEKQYAAYTLALENKDKELADSLKSIYKLKEDDYVTYLRNLYKATEDSIKKSIILENLKGSGLTREKAFSVSKIQPINVIVEVDTKSINALERQLKALEDKRKAALTKSERDLLDVKIDATKRQLEVAEGGINDERNLYEDLHRDIDSFSAKELQGYIDYWKDKLATAKQGSDFYIEIQNKIANATLKINERTIAQSSQLMSEASRLFRGFGDGAIADFIDDFNEIATKTASSLNVLSNENASNLDKTTSIVGLFVTAYLKLKEITDDLNKNTRLENQIDINQNVLEQVRIENAINKIYQDRNDLIRESSVLLDSLYKDDYSSQFEKSTASLEIFTKSLEALKSGAVIRGSAKTSGVFGLGAKTKNYDFNLDQILGFLNGDTRLPGSYNDGVSRDAFLDSVNSINNILEAMGKTASDVANFSSTEWLDFLTIVEASGRLTEETTKLLFDEAKNALEEYQKALENMRNVISEFAGSLGGDLSNALVNAFATGESAALSFKESVSSVLQDLFLNELINSTFKDQFDKLQAEMESSFGYAGDQSWIDDIKRFSENISPQFQEALDAMEAFNNELVSEGFTGFGDTGNGNSQTNSGLQGAIRRELTEETAGELVGLYRGQFDLAKMHYQLSQKHLDSSNNLELLSGVIAENTANTVVELKNAVIELKKIVDNTEKIYQNDLGI